MALAFAQNLGNLETASGTSLSGTFGSSTVSGNAVIAAVRVGAIGRSVTVSDSKSNSYAQATSQQQAADGHELFCHYALNISAGASHQVTASIGGASASIRMTLLEEAGVATASAVDQTNSGSGSDASPVSGNVTTTQADELLFGASSNGSGLTITVGAGYGHLIVSPASNPKLGSEDRIVSATGTYNATFTQSFGDFWACLIVTFKAAGAGGSNKAVVPAAVNATSAVTASLQRLAAVTPAAVTSSSPVTASLVALKQFHAAVAATSTVTATATRIASLHVAAVNATSSVGAAISGIAQNVVDNFRMKKRRRF